MRKQTKLVAVLSTAALLAIGASMTSFAAQGWAEEDGTWVYYDRSGNRVTDQWAKSGNNWYYLNSDGEMATDQLIDDGDNYYYVDVNGVMASNQWVAIDNADAGQDNEPDHYWYYFQANGKAITNGNNDNVSLKTINGKKYAFDSEGKMLYGWVAADSAERIDNTNGDAFTTGDYYFGGPDDGAMTVGWLQTDITYDDATNDSYKYVAPVFSDDSDQTRWFYFQSNGKKVHSTEQDKQKDKTINGKKYSFDENGAMVAEWNMDQSKASSSTASASAPDAAHSQAWRYYNSVDDGARLSNGWFKVVPAEMLDSGNYNDDSDAWYYADGNGHLYAGQFKTIKGKKYAFDNNGRMVDGLKLIKNIPATTTRAAEFDVLGDDKTYDFETESDFDNNAYDAEIAGYRFYYFGDGTDGSMKTGNTTVPLDGDNYSFYFETAGGVKGAGKAGEKDSKFYNGGKLVRASKDDKYEVVGVQTGIAHDAMGSTVYGYTKYDDMNTLANKGFIHQATPAEVTANLKNWNLNKKPGDISEMYVFNTTTDADGAIVPDLPNGFSAVNLVNTSGKKMGNGKFQDGNDYYYVIQNNQLKGIYSLN